jgi:hypothetical protein
MKTNEKMVYVAPKVEVIRVTLEGLIASSPIQSVELKDWDYESYSDDVKNNADIWVNF